MAAEKTQALAKASALPSMRVPAVRSQSLNLRLSGNIVYLTSLVASRWSLCQFLQLQLLHVGAARCKGLALGATAPRSGVVRQPCFVRCISACKDKTDHEKVLPLAVLLILIFLLACLPRFEDSGVGSGVQREDGG